MNTNNDTFEPLVITFCCYWCSYTGADLAGTSRIQYPPNIRIVRVQCTGMIHPNFVIEALTGGADGVLVCGCHPGDCHYKEGNFSALKRISLLKRVLKQRGVEEERLCLDWVSATEAEKFVKVVEKMAVKLQEIGPFSGKKYA